MFRRRKKDEEELEEDTEPEAGSEVEQRVAPPRPQGPWDAGDAPDDDLNRLDLGGLRVPVPPETEVRVDVSPEGEVVAATLVRGASAMQINAFAAPRSAGIWDEVREEMVAALKETGAQAVTKDGPWGAELHATVPAQLPGESPGVAPARFLGVDGPRWFLRAAVTGPAAIDPAAAADLEEAFRGVVVSRGGEAMAVRSPLPLRLPPEVVQAAPPGPPGTQPEADAAEGPSLELPERGPEITERR